MALYSQVISPLAWNDLKEIYQYGVRNWGTVQASNYLDSLKNCIWDLTENPKIGIERQALLANMRSFPVASHLLFYRLIGDQVEIVRILHASQDPQRHIR